VGTMPCELRHANSAQSEGRISPQSAPRLSPNPKLGRSRFPNPQLVSDAQCRWYRSPQLTLSLARGSTPHYYSEGYNRTRGDLRQLAATLNKPPKRSPGAYARAFLSIARNRATGELKEYDQQADPIALHG